MYKPKTRPTEVIADTHVAAIAKEEQRIDAQTLLALMRKVIPPGVPHWITKVDGEIIYLIVKPVSQE